MFSVKSIISQSTEKLKLVLAKPAPTEDERLLLELSSLRDQIEACNERFNLLSDEDLTDACIYELSSLQSKYRYLLKKVKDSHIRCAFQKQAKLERTG